LQQDITNLMQDEMAGHFEKVMYLGAFWICCHSLIHSIAAGSALKTWTGVAPTSYRKTD
jgi:hypothetical protein